MVILTLLYRLPLGAVFCNVKFNFPLKLRLISWLLSRIGENQIYFLFSYSYKTRNLYLYYYYYYFECLANSKQAVRLPNENLASVDNLTNRSNEAGYLLI